MTEKRSSRFEPSLLTDKVVPALLGLLVLVLVAVVVLVGLSVAGLAGV